MLEETGAAGTTDTNPRSIFKLMTLLEKRVILDAKLTGHKLERPPEVRRGEAADTMMLTHESFSVFKPNPVAKVQQVKASNIAGWIGLRALSNSNYLTMVWRFSGFAWSFFLFLRFCC